MEQCYWQERYNCPLKNIHWLSPCFHTCQPQGSLAIAKPDLNSTLGTNILFSFIKCFCLLLLTCPLKRFLDISSIGRLVEISSSSLTSPHHQEWVGLTANGVSLLCVLRQWLTLQRAFLFSIRAIAPIPPHSVMRSHHGDTPPPLHEVKEMP